MATFSDVVPSSTSIVLFRVAPFSMVGRAVLDEPSVPPSMVRSTAAILLVVVQEASTRVPIPASGTVTGAGSKDAANADT